MFKVKVALTILFIIFFSMIITTFLVYDDLFNKNDLNSDITYKNTENPKPTIDENPDEETTFTIKVYDSYEDILLKFKNYYIDCVNEDKYTVSEFLIEGSYYEKYLTKNINNLKEQNIKLKLKDINLIDVEKDGEFLFFYVEEEIGIKEIDKDFEYIVSKMKYKVEVTELGYIFEDEEKI